MSTREEVMPRMPDQVIEVIEFLWDALPSESTIPFHVRTCVMISTPTAWPMEKTICLIDFPHEIDEDLTEGPFF